MREFDGLPKPFPANHVSARGQDVKSEPCVTMEQIGELSNGLICFIGKTSSVAQLLQTNRIDSARKRLEAYHHIFGTDRVYVQLVNHLERGDTGVCRLLSRLANEKSLGCVASNGARYATQAEARLHHVLRCIAHKTTLSKSESIRAVNHERYLKSPREMQLLFAEIPSAITNTRAILERCNVDLDLLFIATSRLFFIVNRNLK